MTVEFDPVRHEQASLDALLQRGLSVPFPDTFPDGVREIEKYLLARVWRVQKYKHKGLLVLGDVSLKADDRLWYHVSFSRKTSMPSYDDRAYVKRHFIGDDRWAIEVLPEKEQHVNIMPYCLHLWHCLEERVVPDFRTTIFGSLSSI
jgi:hypothetical protein